MPETARALCLEILYESQVHSGAPLPPSHPQAPPQSKKPIVLGALIGLAGVILSALAGVLGDQTFRDAGISGGLVVSPLVSETLDPVVSPVVSEPIDDDCPVSDVTSDSVLVPESPAATVVSSNVVSCEPALG